MRSELAPSNIRPQARDDSGYGGRSPGALRPRGGQRALTVVRPLALVGLIGGWNATTVSPGETIPGARGDEKRRHIVTILGTPAPTVISPKARQRREAGRRECPVNSLQQATINAPSGRLPNPLVSPRGHPRGFQQGGRSWHGPCISRGMDTKTLKQARQSRMIQSRAVAYTFGPYAVTCEIVHPSGLVLAYGIGLTQQEATEAAFQQIRA